MFISSFCEKNITDNEIILDINSIQHDTRDKLKIDRFLGIKFQGMSKDEGRVINPLVLCKKCPKK